MTPFFSVLLDLIRALSAFVVALAHLSFLSYRGEFKDCLVWAAHPAVIIFFVLSGYVIAFSCYTKHTNFHGYTLARLVRLYPVYLTALVLIPILDFFGRNNAPGLYINYPYPSLEFIGLIYLFFLQELDVFNSIKYFSDGPLWSLSYEFWYYIFFGLIVYYYKSIFKSKLIVLIFVILGLSIFLRIILLFPAWLCGVVLYDLTTNKKIKLSPSLCLYGCLLSGIVFVGIVFPSPLEHFITQMTFRFQLLLSTELAFSSTYIRDYLIGCTFAIFLFFAEQTTRRQDFASSFMGLFLKNNLSKSLIKTFSGFSYTLYALHVPLILFMSSFYLFDSHSLTHQFIILVLIYLITFILSFWLERPNKKILNKIYTVLKITP